MATRGAVLDTKYSAAVLLPKWIIVESWINETMSRLLLASLRRNTNCDWVKVWLPHCLTTIEAKTTLTLFKQTIIICVNSHSGASITCISTDERQPYLTFSSRVEKAALVIVEQLLDFSSVSKVNKTLKRHFLSRGTAAGELLRCWFM